jgi:hypothetical protein
MNLRKGGAMATDENADRPYRLIVRIKNNRLWRAILKKWPDVTSQLDAATRLGVRQTVLGDLLNIKRFPGRVQPDGVYWGDLAFQISSALDCEPEHLFDPNLYGRRSKTQVLEIADLTAVKMLPAPTSSSPEQILDAEELAIRMALRALTPREEQIIRLRFGRDVGGDLSSLKEISERFAMTEKRLWRIEGKALWKLPEEICRLLLKRPDQAPCQHDVRQLEAGGRVCVVCKTLWTATGEIVGLQEKPTRFRGGENFEGTDRLVANMAPQKRDHTAVVEEMLATGWKFKGWRSWSSVPANQRYEDEDYDVPYRCDAAFADRESPITGRREYLRCGNRRYGKERFCFSHSKFGQALVEKHKRERRAEDREERHGAL